MPESILWMSDSRESLPIAWRMANEGIVDVKYFINSPAYRRCYRGMLPIITHAELKKALVKCDTVVFDLNLTNHRSPADLQLLRMFGISAKAPYVFGPVSDKLRKTHRVIGGTSWAEHMEHDRLAGIELMQKVGLEIPEYEVFKSLKKGADFLRANSDRCWVFKPFDNQNLKIGAEDLCAFTMLEKEPGDLIGPLEDHLQKRLGTDKVEFLLQEVVPGIELSTEGWFDGKDWVHFNHTIEEKKFMDGNLGRATGCQSSLVWMKRNQDGLLADVFKKMGKYMRWAELVGSFDWNCIISEDKAYGLEATPRHGWDSIFNLLDLNQDSITSFYLNDFKCSFKDGFAASQRVTIPPYPYFEPKMLNSLAKDVPIYHRPQDLPHLWMEDVYATEDGQMACAGTDGWIGTMGAHGDTVEEAVGNVFKHLKKLKIGAELQWRTAEDQISRANKRIKKLKSWGLEIF